MGLQQLIYAGVKGGGLEEIQDGGSSWFVVRWPAIIFRPITSCQPLVSKQIS